jgi:signal transduction histidine kinase
MFLGFGLMVGLWLFAGYQFTRRMAEVEREAAAMNGRYMAAQELLSTVRAQILIGSVYVRDALLDPTPGAAATYRAQLQRTYTSINQALRQYVPIIDTIEQRDRIGMLRREIENFQATMLEVLESDSTQWSQGARGLLQQRIVPKREMAIRMSEQVQALNRETFVQQQLRIAEIYSGSQRRVWRQMGAALAAGVAIALLATLYAGRLETRLREQMARDVQATHDLQRLSAKLLNVQEEERRAIARELHDEVGQVLMAIKVEVAVAQNAIAQGGGSTRILEEVKTITDGALVSVRDLSRLLHPALLDDLGLIAAIEWHIRGFAKRHNVQVDLLHDGMDERLEPQIETVAFRIVQEALTNVAKHSRATLCRVFLQRLQDTVLMTIEDNGVGFDVQNLRESGVRAGLGLVSMRERVAHLSGTLRVESSDSSGTRITAEIPLRPRNPLGASADLGPLASLAARGARSYE